MNGNLIPHRPQSLTEITWSGTVLNTYVVGLMLIAPIWAGYLVRDGAWLSLMLLIVLIAALIGLCLLPRPLLAYDPVRRVFFSPEGESLELDKIAAIEMDAHDIYFIPKSHTDKGWHLSRRGWITAPRRVLMAQAALHGWPLKDITHPLSRIGSWIVP